ncbi:Ada metal-binding domain-containing protein [Fusibacter bizertensis]|uniref:DNA-3-methyladenine glycosylase II n=1 Tax=Fusibacter bizertensis TaxID=1488331 RepID=A0ABT6NFX6_9FIRM|nr:Ada metal-binding domain-containing protein [Fusibacter bizertensis]MDH8679314.1 Ada metal-binding domain-containing protein [Fusibacter bizertensis]
MKLSQQSCYEIIKSKDSRFDGVFFTVVKTTGIYCRPICKVPPPKQENCDFYETAYQAEQAGYRPCLRCRPEMAPEYSEFEQSDYMIKQLLTFFDEENYCAGLVQKSADYFGITARHVNRLFHNALGISPQQYIMTKRLLNGKRLLQDTNLSATEISGIVGFGSPNRFYQALKSKYKMSPSEIRGKEKKRQNTEWITIKIAYRPPYRWGQMMDYFKLRAIPQVEWVDAFDVYRRTLRVALNEELYQGYIEVKPVPEQNHISVKVSRGLEKVLLQVIKSVKKAFDLDAIPEALPEGINKGIRLPGCFDGFEVVLRAIIGQQITVKAATTLSGRMVAYLGEKTQTPWDELSRFFPSPKEFRESGLNIVDTLGSLGIISLRGRAIASVVDCMLNQEISFEKSKGPDELIESLMKIKGIGIWTAQYVAMRSLSWPDVFLESDLIIKQKLTPHLDPNLKYARAATEYAKAYEPWRSYLTFSIWQDHFDKINGLK